VNGPTANEGDVSMLQFVSATAIVILAASACHAQKPERNNERMQQAIDDGVRFLDRNRQEDGGWKLFPQQPGAVTALCVTALRMAGVPADDERIRPALEQIRAIKPTWCYQAAVQTLALCRCDPDKDQLLIRRNVAILEEMQIRKEGPNRGSWNYGSLMGPGDSSNTQWALLALYEAERTGVPTSETVWTSAREYWTKLQNADGSWSYVPGDGRGTGSMTCAGIACLLMADEKLGRGDATVDGDTVRCCGPKEGNTAVESGLNWLGRPEIFSVTRNPGDSAHVLYYLCGLERVGRLSHRRLIRKHAWFREGASYLLDSQDQLSGMWKGVGTGESNEVIGTAMALLFLAQARRSSAAAKLSYGPDLEWDRHGRDLGNLVEHWAARRKQSPMWQIAALSETTADELSGIPVLWISGSKAFQFGDAEVKALRRYVDEGGTIFAENCCDGPDFDASFRTLTERMFPESDGTEVPKNRLRVLPGNHAIFTAEETFDVTMLRATPFGIEHDSRTAVIYYPANLGCSWDLDRPGRKHEFPPKVEEKVRAFRSFGLNVMSYASQGAAKKAAGGR
jgi:hypothetical protein